MVVRREVNNSLNLNLMLLTNKKLEKAKNGAGFLVLMMEKDSLKLEFGNLCYRKAVNILMVEITQLLILHSVFISKRQRIRKQADI